MATLQELAEALTSSQTSALLQKVIDDNLVDVLRKEEPLKGALPVREWGAATYFWNLRNRLPYGQATTEAPPTTGTGSVTATQSNYVQSSVPIGHYQVQGDLSKFNIKVATASISNLLETEMTQATQGMAWVEAAFHLYGSLAATATSQRPQWDGFDRQIAASSSVRFAPNGGAGTALTLLDLDNLVDAVRVGVAAPLPGEDFFLLMSEPMLSKVGRLARAQEQVLPSMMLKPRRTDVNGGTVNLTDPGIEVPCYRGIPIVGTSFLSPNGIMSTVTAAATGTDGGVTTAQRFYAIEAITQYGPTYAAAANATPGGTTNHVDLTFAKPVIADAFGNALPILQYRVYEGASSGAMTLYGVVAATDAADADVTTIRDFGVVSAAGSIVANPGANQVPGLFTGATNVAGDGVNLAPASSQPAAGYEESLWLISRKPDFVCVPTVTEIESEILANVNARTVQYALIGDKALAVRANRFAAKLQRATTV